MTHSEFLQDEAGIKEFISKLITAIRTDDESYYRATAIVSRGEYKGLFTKIKFGNIYMEEK